MNGENSRKVTKSYVGKLVAVVLAIIVILGAIWGSQALITLQRHRHTQAMAAKRHALISQAAQVLGPQHIKDLKPLTAQIKQQPNYSSDQSYMFILLTYSINLSDAKSASSELQQLNRVYRGDAAYDSSLQPHIVTQKDLQQTVVFLQQQAKEVKSNMTFGTNGRP